MENRQIGKMLGRTASVFFDAVGLNVCYFLFLKNLVFIQIGRSSAMTAAAVGTAFIALFLATGRLELWSGRQSRRSAAIQLILAGLFALAVHQLATLMPDTQDNDYSWLRVEFIKTPLWLRMHIAHAPVYTAASVFVVAAMIFATLRRPKARALRVAAALAIPAHFAFVASTLALPGEIGADYNAPYLLFFGAPPALFLGLFAAKAYRPAFRMAPLAFHMLTVFLFYIGQLPGHLPYSRDRFLANLGGATLLYDAERSADRQMMPFSRDLLPVPGGLVATYGPMGQTLFIKIERAADLAREIVGRGLVRDVDSAEGGRDFWAVNWQEAALQLVEGETLSTLCAADLRPDRLTTPWALAVDGRRFFISNVTDPIVAEYVRVDDAEPCRFELRHSLNLREIGYTDFTDGAFGLHFDSERNRLYVAVAMLEGRHLTSLIEIDGDTFQILRDLRLKAGMVVTPLEGTRNVLLPSYYLPRIYEVSLQDMQIVRVLAAEENIFSLAYDARRGLIYAVSKVGGDLLVLDYASGRVVARAAVGARPGSLLFEKNDDALVISSGLGVMRTSLPALLESLGVAAKILTPLPVHH